MRSLSSGEQCTGERGVKSSAGALLLPVLHDYCGFFADGQMLLERSAFTVRPVLSENSVSIKAAVASAWPSLSSTFLMALAIFLNAFFISAIEYDLQQVGRLGQIAMRGRRALTLGAEPLLGWSQQSLRRLSWWLLDADGDKSITGPWSSLSSESDDRPVRASLPLGVVNGSPFNDREVSFGYRFRSG